MAGVALPPARPLATRRLALDPLRPGDAAALHPVFADPEVMRWVGEADGCEEETALRLLRAASGDCAATTRGWVVRQDGAVAGLVSLDRILDGMADLTCLFLPARWGRGLAAEAAAAVLGFAFRDLGLHRVQLRSDPENGRAHRLAERLGFTRETRTRQSNRLRNEWRDEVTHGLLSREWRG